MSMFIPEEINTPAKLNTIKILQKQSNFSLRQIKEYIDSYIGKYSILPKTILQTEVLVQRNQRQIVIYSYRLQLVKNSEVNRLRQQKCQWQQSNTTTLLKVRILDKHVGLISIHTEQVRTGKLKILICKIVLVQTLKSCSITIFHILIQLFRQLNLDLWNTKSSIASMFICEYRYTSCTHKAAFTWRVC